MNRNFLITMTVIFMGLFSLAGPIGGVSTVSATTITVTTTDDELNADGDCSLREAIVAANTDAAVDDCPAGSGADVIYLAATTYPLTEPNLGGNEDQAATGDLDIRENLTIYGAIGTTIDAAGLDRVFHVHGSAADPIVQLVNLSIVNGEANQGSGIMNDDGYVYLINSTISNCGRNMGQYGGAIYNRIGFLQVIDSSLTFNRALYDGGGIHNNNGIVTVSNSAIDDNYAVRYGGGIYNGPHSRLEVTSQSTVDRNSAATGKGGGIYSYSDLVVTDSSVSDNVTEGAGGGIYSFLGTNTIARATLAENRATLQGGGISIEQNVTTSMDASDLIDNWSSQGGAIYNERGNFTLTDSTVTSNQVDDVIGAGQGEGGGIFNDNGTFIANNVLIENNHAIGDPAVAGTGRAGGIHSQGGSFDLLNSQVLDNSATLGPSSNGGGSYFMSGTVTIENSTISGNLADNEAGGAYFNNAISVTINESTIANNDALQHFGGGLNINLSNFIQIDDSTIAGNFSDMGGGGIHAFNTNMVVINNSTIMDNETASVGGGIHSRGTTMILNNTTISGNIAAAAGGANSFNGDLILNNSTITNNSAPVEGGLRVSANLGPASIQVKNSIVANQAQGWDCVGNPIQSFGYNIESDGTCNFGNSGDQQVDPVLLPLDDYGGPTLTHHLAWDSPAIDAGDPLGCQGDLDGNGAADALLADQRGQIRVDVPGAANEPADHVCDIGAVEHNLVINAGMEDNDDEDHLPDVWVGHNLTPATDTQNCQHSHSGECMFVLKADGGIRKGIYQVLERDGDAGDEYTLQVWNATRNVFAPGRLGAAVAVRYADGTGGYFFVPFNRGTHGAELASDTFIIPQDYVRLVVSPVYTRIQDGRVAVDDVSLVQHR